jgi:ElaB/YqjD/DUF883 family membrane-anchored ribosome-binding protein
MSPAEKGPAQTMGDQESPRDPAKIRGEIEDARAELGETVAAVAEKTDVKRQVQAKKGELKGQAARKANEAKAKVEEATGKVVEAAPESATEGVQQAQRLAQENPVPLAIAGAFVAGLVLGRLFSR